MDYFFTTIFPKIMAGFLVIILVLDVVNHLFKKKLIEYVLLSEERRQRHIRMDSIIVSYEKKLFWQLLVMLPLLALSTYYFLPHLFYLPIVIILFCPFVLDDYFRRKSILRAIDKKIEGEIL